MVGTTDRPVKRFARAGRKPVNVLRAWVSHVNESALNANVGLKLRTLRLSRNIKQSDAAKDLGVSAAYLNLIEKGKRVTPFPLLWKALRYFEQEPEQFMSTLG